MMSKLPVMCLHVSAQVRTGKDKLDRSCQIRTGHVQLGQGQVILEHVKLSQTGQVKLNRSSQNILWTKIFLNTLLNSK